MKVAVVHLVERTPGIRDIGLNISIVKPHSHCYYSCRTDFYLERIC